MTEPKITEYFSASLDIQGGPYKTLELAKVALEGFKAKAGRVYKLDEMKEDFFGFEDEWFFTIGYSSSKERPFDMTKVEKLNALEGTYKTIEIKTDAKHADEMDTRIPETDVKTPKTGTVSTMPGVGS